MWVSITECGCLRAIKRNLLPTDFRLERMVLTSMVGPRLNASVTERRSRPADKGLYSPCRHIEAHSCGPLLTSPSPNTGRTRVSMSVGGTGCLSVVLGQSSYEVCPLSMGLPGHRKYVYFDSLEAL